jgi:hypothetical protein
MDALFCLYLLAWLPYVLTQTFCQEVSVRMSNITSYIDYNDTTDYFTISHWSHLSYKGNPDVSIGTLYNCDEFGSDCICEYRGGDPTGCTSLRRGYVSYRWASQEQAIFTNEMPACRYNFVYEMVLSSTTPTPMYFVTLFPTATPSAPQTPSTTPMFMVTAWPTTSPQNVSPSSTPLYFMTAYPTNDPNNGTLAGGAGSGGGGSTSIILGAVAVAGVAGGGIAYVVKHFRSGGSVKSLIATAIRNRSKIADTLKDIPLPDSVKSKMMNAESMIPDSAKDLIKAAKSSKDMINDLPIPEELKSHLKRKVGNINMEEKLMKMLQDASGVDLKPVLDTAEDGEVEEEVEEVQTVNVLLDEKPATTIVVDQGIALTSRASKKSVNIVVGSEEGTDGVSK